MDIIAFNEASTANGRIESFIENPDSTSGIVTVPKTIASGETITIPAGRVAILPNVVVDGILNIEDGGEVFIPSGSTFGDLDAQIALKAPLVSPAFTGTPTAPTQSAQDNSTKLATTSYVDGKMVLGTAVNSTSRTSIDFIGIPSWAKRITVMMKDISLSGASSLLVQIGNTTIQTTGYNSSSGGAINSAVPAVIGSTAGFIILNDVATDAFTAIMKIYNITGNSYIEKFNRGGTTGRTVFSSGAGSVTLSAVLDRIRITTANGTDTFDAGQINILYEG